MTAPLAVTPGDPAGVGPDLLLATAAGGAPGLVAFADSDFLARRAAELGLQLDLRPWQPGDPLPATGLAVAEVPLATAATAGEPDPANAPTLLTALDRAVAAVREGACAGLVTGPLSKAVIARGTDRPFTGHTEYLAEGAGGARPVMMLVGRGLRVALVTTHLPLRAVPDAVTPAAVAETVRTTVTALHREFARPRPRVLVTGLNPHAGEGGTLGTEERDIIQPALAELARELADTADLEGPLPADTAFLPACTERADAVVAMYHDQGLAPLKQHAFGRAVNITLGLPFVRTSVDHGTAYDLAGTGRADPGSFREAVAVARELAANRARANHTPI
jgi:4-hydroxythreonine-4-phosphate dehydrogenase